MNCAGCGAAARSPKIFGAGSFAAIAGRIVISSICISLLLPGLCAGQNEVTPDNLFEMSMEELMDVPVVSASRLPTKPRYLSSPVTVITAEDIHYSGATNIPELLQFAPGVDVRRLDRQRYIVGVRGLAGSFSDRTLVLIDGRPMMDPIYGGTHWENIPVLMEDIERIEIVRGPGGAAWGANAFTGVINIITKEPGQCQGGLMSTTVNEYGDTFTHLRYGETHGPWSWKVSAGYEDVEDSDAAGAGRYYSGAPEINLLMNFGSFDARDWGRYWKFDSEAEYRVDEQTKWIFGAAHSSGQEGDFEFIGSFPRRDFLTEYTRLFARLEHQFDEDTSAHLQWFGDYYVSHRRTLVERAAYMHNDLEGQITFKPADDHTTSVGGNLRWDHISADNYSLTNEFIFDKNTYNEYWAGLFFIDRWEVTERLTLEEQIRLDNYSETTTDWSARLTALYALDDQQNHILRAGFARAFRSPCLATRSMSASYLSMVPWGFPGTDMFITQPSAGEIDNEGTYSLEAGYSGKLTDRLSLSIDSYYQRMERLIGVRNATDMFGATTSTVANVAGADSWGAEVSMTWRHNAGQITGWYAYNGFATDEHEQVMRALQPAAHKAGLSGRWTLDKDWTFNTNYVFQNSISTYKASMEDPQSFHRLDLTLSRKFAKGAGELMIGVSDVLNETGDPVYDTGNFTAMETPGRTLFGRLQIKF